MQSDLSWKVLSRLTQDGVRAELRNCSTPSPMELSICESTYTFGLILSQQRRQNETSWSLPGSGRAVRPRLFTFIPAGIELKGDRAACDFDCLRLDISPSFFKSFADFEFDGEELFARSLQFKSSSIHLFFQRMAHELKHPSPFSQELCSNLTECVVIEFARMMEPTQLDGYTPGLSDWQLKTVRQIIADTEGAAGSKISLIAEKCGISGRHLMRGFKAATGVTIHNYFDQVRLERTAKLLRSGDLPLKVIALSVGFSSPAHMSTAFRLKMGVTPSEYRMQMRH